MIPQASPDPNVMGIQFLLTELDTGFTFVHLSESAHGDLKMERNRKNARAAYNSVLHFFKDVALDQEQSQKVRAKLTSLKTRLQNLGEPF